MVRTALVGFLAMLLVACTGLPNRVEPVSGFELPRYLGTWYEIARLDHSFERGLSRVTAEYSMRDDGGVPISSIRRILATSKFRSSARSTAPTPFLAWIRTIMNTPGFPGTTRIISGCWHVARRSVMNCSRHFACGQGSSDSILTG
jgi:hypothetical protein